MRPVPFTKMSGVGNDFIIVDNRAGILSEVGVSEFARRVCARRVSLGGDELIVIEPPTAGGDFSMRTINPDGAEVKMCGNAARCVARYADARGLAGANMTIDTLGGPVRARIAGDAVSVELRLTSRPELDIQAIDSEIVSGEGSATCGDAAQVAGASRGRVTGQTLSVHSVEISGAPHVVVYLHGVADAPGALIHRLGATIRYHPGFVGGTNVNFVQVLDRHALWQRTYERGVEGETLACGTGAAASSIVSALRGLVDSPVRVYVLDGELNVSFERRGDAFADLFLGGGTRFIAEGALHPEAWP